MSYPASYPASYPEGYALCLGGYASLGVPNRFVKRLCVPVDKGGVRRAYRFVPSPLSPETFSEASQAWGEQCGSE
jgi:hypothetical protein